MNVHSNEQTRFYELVDAANEALEGQEILIANAHVEQTDFVRFNQGRVRQAGTVDQRDLELRLIAGKRHAKTSLSLSADHRANQKLVLASIRQLRGLLGHLPEDPHLLFAQEPQSTEQIKPNLLPSSQDIVQSVVGACQTPRGTLDLVGIYAAGGVQQGFANSLGQRNWFATHSFNLDWCLYHSADKAVKSTYAGFEWKQDRFEKKMASAERQLDVLKQPAKTIEPGQYRVYLAPAAMDEMVSLLCWGGFGAQYHQTKTSPLLRLVQGEQSLNAQVSIAENTAQGTGAGFQGAGFLRPTHVDLIKEGRCSGALVSPRSAIEYGLQTNGAGEDESPQSLDMAGGSLDANNLLKQLDTGVWINNLWYLNYSDRSACRMTGMTRFACFWVENGQIVAPINVMRFDETAYRTLGDNLEGLTQDREFMMSTDTYYRRSTNSSRLPGAIVRDFPFTL